MGVCMCGGSRWFLVGVCVTQEVVYPSDEHVRHLAAMMKTGSSGGGGGGLIGFISENMDNTTHLNLTVLTPDTYGAVLLLLLYC